MENLDNIKKVIERVEANSVSDEKNSVNLLDVASSFVDLYHFIKTSSLQDISTYERKINDKYTCLKEGYDEIEGKTTYRIENEKGEKVFGMALDNYGKFYYDFVPLNALEYATLSSSLFGGEDALIFDIRKNAAISFFNEDRALLISKEPHVSLKIKDFLYGTRCALVCEDGDNSFCVSIDNIKDLLSNVKIPRKSVPFLAYAFYDSTSLDNDKENIFAKKDRIMKKTYPALTKEEKERFLSKDYLEKNVQEILLGAVSASLLMGTFGYVLGIGSFPLLLSMAVPGSIPLAIGGGILSKKVSNVYKAKRQDSKKEEANNELYNLLEDSARQGFLAKTNDYLSEFSALNDKVDYEAIKNSDLSKKVLSAMQQSPYHLRPFYYLQLYKILNTCKDSQDLETYLYSLIDRINKTDPNDLSGFFADTVDLIDDLSDRSSPLDTIEELNKVSYERNRLALWYDRDIDLETLNDKLSYAYLRQIIRDDYGENTSQIPQREKGYIISYVQRNYPTVSEMCERSTFISFDDQLMMYHRIFHDSLDLNRELCSERVKTKVIPETK